MEKSCGIGITTPDNKILAAFCENGAGVDEVGVLLYLFYNNKERAKALVDKGYIYSLGIHLGYPELPFVTFEDRQLCFNANKDLKTSYTSTGVEYNLTKRGFTKPRLYKTLEDYQKMKDVCVLYLFDCWHYGWRVYLPNDPTVYKQNGYFLHWLIYDYNHYHTFYLNQNKPEIQQDPLTEPLIETEWNAIREKFQKKKDIMKKSDAAVANAWLDEQGIVCYRIKYNKEKKRYLYDLYFVSEREKPYREQMMINLNGLIDYVCDLFQMNPFNRPYFPEKRGN